MRKYLLNASVITTVASGFGLLQSTRKGPRDWRLALMWVGWAITVALAIGAVSQKAEQEKREQLEA
ncbi:hypothetical protein GCM10027416_13180 [Okibacterium endophyticum]